MAYKAPFVNNPGQYQNIGRELDVKLNYLLQRFEQQREISSIYQQGLPGLSQLQLPPPPLTDNHYYDVFQNYVVRTQKRDDLAAYVKKNGAEIIISWPIYMNHQKTLKLSRFKLPKTEAISLEIVSLPMYPELENEQVKYVIQVVRNSYSMKYTMLKPI